MLSNTAKSVTSSGLPLRLHSCRTEQHHVLNRGDDGTISRSEPDFERVQFREVHRTSHLSVTTMLATHHAGKVTDERLVLWTSAGQEHVILRLVTGLVAQRRAESATCSRRHAVNLVPLDEFALGGYCFHAVAHVCLCHGAHRRALALGAGGAPSRAAGGQTRPSRHGVSKPERRGTMRHARMSDVSRGCAPPAAPGALRPPTLRALRVPRKSGFGGQIC